LVLLEFTFTADPDIFVFCNIREGKEVSEQIFLSITEGNKSNVIFCQGNGDLSLLAKAKTGRI